MGIFHKISSWWNKDRTELSDEEASMTQAERDVAEEDYESRKDDCSSRTSTASGAGAAGLDFERDSERPREMKRRRARPTARRAPRVVSIDLRAYGVKKVITRDTRPALAAALPYASSGKARKTTLYVPLYDSASSLRLSSVKMAAPVRSG